MVVRTIFQLKMEGYSQQAIANYLSSEGVLPPAAYKQQQGLKYQSGFQAVGDNNAWSPVAVRAILENPIYIGTLVQGKRGTPNYISPAVPYRKRHRKRRRETRQACCSPISSVAAAETVW